MADFADTAEEVEQKRIAEEAARRRLLGLGSAPSRAAAVASGLPPAEPAPPAGPPIPSPMPQLGAAGSTQLGAAGSTQLGAAAPPPGFLAGTLGGAEVPGGVRGTPIPLRPSATLPGGMTSTPVSSPAAAPAPGNGPLDALREQMSSINKLIGAAPQAPQINHAIDNGSPTAGLAQLGGRMVGNQNHGGVTVDPAAALQAAIFHTQDTGHGADQRAMLERLGVMGNQAVAGGHLSLDALRALGVGGVGGTIRDNSTSVAQQGRAAELTHGPDAQNAAAYQAHVAARQANGGSLAEARAEWIQAGNKLPVFAGGSAISPLSPSNGAPPVPAAPGGAATTGAGQVPPPTPSQGTSERLNQVYQRIQRQQSGVGPGQNSTARITDPNAGITDMIHTLGESYVTEHAPEVMKFIADRFGGPAANDWFTHRSSLLGRPTPQERAIQIIQRAANARAPGTVGNSSRNDETGGPARAFPWDSNAFGVR